MRIRKTVFVACAAVLCATSGTVPVATTGTANAQSGGDEVSVSIIGRRGRPMRLRSLPEADQARIARLQESARSFRAQQAAFRRVTIGIRCTWPPLRCTIVIVVS
jgi:hypothetical protein